MQTTNKYPAALPGWIEATPIQPETGCVSRPANRLRAPLAAPGRTLSGQEVTPPPEASSARGGCGFINKHTQSIVSRLSGAFTRQGTVTLHRRGPERPLDVDSSRPEYRPNVDVRSRVQDVGYSPRLTRRKAEQGNGADISVSIDSEGATNREVEVLRPTFD